MLLSMIQCIGILNFIQIGPVVLEYICYKHNHEMKEIFSLGIITKLRDFVRVHLKLYLKAFLKPL